MAAHSSILAWRIPWTIHSVAESDTTEATQHTHMSVPISKFIPPSTPHLVIHTFVLYVSVSVFLLCKQVHLYEKTTHFDVHLLAACHLFSSLYPFCPTSRQAHKKAWNQWRVQSTPAPAHAGTFTPAPPRSHQKTLSSQVFSMLSQTMLEAAQKCYAFP